MSNANIQVVSADLEDLLASLESDHGVSATVSSTIDNLLASSDLDSLLDDVDIEVAAPLIPAVEIVAISEEEEDAAVAALESREAFYADQESEASELSKPDATAAEKTAARKRVNKAADPATKEAGEPEEAEPGKKLKKASAPRTAMPTDVFLETDGPASDCEALIAPLAVKVKEKARNMIAYLSTGAALSVYTRIALDHLIEKQECDSASIKAVMEAKGYTSGTASSQAGQVSQLFCALKVAEKVGRTGMKINPESRVVLNHAS